MSALVEDVLFKTFEAEDREWMLQAMVESFRATSSPYRTASEDKLLEDARTDLVRYHDRAKTQELILLAWKGDERIGVVWITMDTLMQAEGCAWLLEVYVDPRYRGLGLAKELLIRAEDWARTNGAKEIWLNVGGSNKKAIDLYSSQGYRVETMHMSKVIRDRS